VIELELDGPIDLAASLRHFGRWGDDGLDRWDGTTLVRTSRMADGQVGPYVATTAGNIASPRLLIDLPAAHAAMGGEVVDAVRATFVALPRALADVAATDGAVRDLAARYAGVRPVLVPDPFTALVRSVSAQQVNLTWASVVRRRLAERYGTRHEVGGTYVYSLDPLPLATASVDELREVQLTTAKSRSVIACARAAADGRLQSAALAALDDEALIQRLVELPGIGRWSAEWFLARTLGRPRVVAGDLGVRKAVGRMYESDSLPSDDEVRRLTDHWGAAATHIQALALFDLVSSAGAV
jgi:DNA-3-methyladenine glycosylase II